MNQEQVELLMQKSKEELVAIIIKLDKKLFDLIKELGSSDEYKGIITDKSLNDFFAMRYEDKEED